MAECPICIQILEAGESYELPCGHCFHGGCAATWFRTRAPTCPVCRALPDVVDDDESDDQDSEDSEISMETLPPEMMHRILRPTLRAASKRDAPRRLKALGARYHKARARLAEVKRSRREHEYYASGSYPQLRRTSAKLQRLVVSSENRLLSISKELLEEL